MAEEQQLIELINAMASSTKEQRDQATKMYKDAKAQSPDQLIMTMMKVVGSATTVDNKKAVIVYLRQLLSNDRVDEFSFPKCQEQNKQEIAKGLLMLFEQAPADVQAKLGVVVTCLAGYVCDEEDQSGWLARGGSTGWPDLLPHFLRLSNCQQNQNMVSVKHAMNVLKELIPHMRAEIVRNQANIGAVLQAALACPDLSVKAAATLLIVDMVEYLEKKDWAPLASTLPMLIQVCMELARSGPPGVQELNDIIQAFIEVAGTEPDFFKASMANSFEPAQFFSGCVKSKDADPEIRGLALEWLTSYAEKKPKWLAKSVPKFAQTALESCMALMLEIDASDSALQEWAERMDDEEGEEDADELYSRGEEAIDRVAEHMGMDAIAQGLFGMIGTFAQQDAWQAKHAALAAVKQTVEYVEEKEHMIEMAKLLMAHVVHPHPRVRYTALHAIGQLANDQAPQFQETFHAQIMPLLMTCMDDKVDRVAAMAMSAFVSFAEELKDIMHTYAHSFMEKFLQRLQSSNHRGIQEESITAIAVIAAVIDTDFKKYYDQTMPLLKQLIMTCTDDKQRRLRGKAFECLSLLGVAVGKEKFCADAQQAIEAMLSTQTSAEEDDVQREYIKEAIERICHCLKKDFAPFLPMVLPGIYKGLNLEEDGGVTVSKAVPNPDEDELLSVNVGGKLVKVKSSKFEEMHQAVSMLNTFISEMDEAFYDYIGPTAQALLPVIEFSDEAAMLCEDARQEAFMTWANLIKAAQKGGQARNVQGPVPMVADLVGKILSTCTQLLNKERQKKEPDTDELSNYASGIAESLKNAGPGYLAAAEAQQIVQMFFGMIDESFVRTQILKKALKQGAEGAPAELQGDEDDEDHDPMEEEECVRRSYEEALGAVMKANPDVFVSNPEVLTGVGQKMAQYLAVKENMVLGLHFACDLLEYLKEKSCPIWPVFMPKLFDALGDKNPDVRTAAAYAVNLASLVPAFAEAAPEAFRRLAKLISAKPPKKRDEKANLAMDNTVAAIFTLGQNMIAQCPPDINPFQMFISKLPIKTDLEEAKKVHKKVCELLMAQHAGLLGANQENVGKILSVLAEIHKQEDTSNEEVDALILQIFKALPQDMLAKLSGNFTEKQQKRIEKILTA